MIGMSACLGGVACRYDGRSQGTTEFIQLVEQDKVVIICPEVLGGLPIPRKPAEIIGGDGYDVLAGKARVVENDGTDVTDIYVAGARKAYEIIKDQGITVLVLKEKSPTCGTHYVYDGNFTGVMKQGVGVATALFRKKGLMVYADTEWELVKKEYANLLV